MMTGFYPVLGS